MILLCTLNSTYQHASFGPRYIFANMGTLQEQTKLLEFTIAQKPRDIAEKILQLNPKIVGFGTYIWNTTETEAVVSILKKVAPEIIVVLGGPEVSYEYKTQTICAKADYVFLGESDFSFPAFCEKIFSNIHPTNKWIASELPDIQKIKSPYTYFSDEDIRNRVLYVEASRGCPYKCEYCLSSLDKSVRNFPLEPFLADLQILIERGARQFKFVDRTFNLSPSISTKILQFFLDRISLGLFLHFEMVPDRLPDDLKSMIKKFPLGSLQFEIGIQTWNPEVSANVSRRQDYAKIKENFQFLRAETHVHTHADLIVGLPGETLESFGAGFNALVELNPDEVQVGILKRLKGTPIIRHDQFFQMKYQEQPPFQILSTKNMDYSSLQKMNRFAKFWDLYANSGNFTQTIQFLKNHTKNEGSFFSAFLHFSEFLSTRHANSFGISLLNLVESAWIFLTVELQIAENEARTLLANDYAFGNKKRDLPNFLKSDITSNRDKSVPKNITKATPARQQRHQIH